MTKEQLKIEVRDADKLGRAAEKLDALLEDPDFDGLRWVEIIGLLQMKIQDLYHMAMYPDNEEDEDEEDEDEDEDE